MNRLRTALAAAGILLVGLVTAVPAGAVDGTEPIATFASGLLNARGIDITSDDAVYIADSGNDRILKIADGVTTVVVGNDNGSDVLTSLDGPRGLDALDDGTIWIADTGNGRILRISGATVSTVATGLSVPSDVTVIGGDAYVAETGANRVVTVETGQAPVVVAGDNGGTPVVTNLVSPSKVVALDSGFMVVDSGGNRIVSIDGGAIVAQLGTGIRGSAPSLLNNPLGVVVGSDGTYVANTFDNSVRKFPTGSTEGVIISQPWANRRPIGVTPTDNFTPVDVALDSDGSLYVLDFVFNSVVKLDASDLSPFEILAGRADLDANHANILRLYWATFDRQPDVGGAEWWIDAFNTGSWPTLVRIAEHFAVSAEFIETYGQTSNAEFVDTLYLNVLDRPGEPGGRTFWIGELDSQRRTRGQVLADFSYSDEFRSNHPLPSDNIAP